MAQECSQITLSHQIRMMNPLITVFRQSLLNHRENAFPRNSSWSSEIERRRKIAAHPWNYSQLFTEKPASTEKRPVIYFIFSAFWANKILICESCSLWAGRIHLRARLWSKKFRQIHESASMDVCFTRDLLFCPVLQMLSHSNLINSSG